MYQNRDRNLVELAINRYHLDLKGYTVLTEAATGYYAWTPVICALAGADVLAFTAFRDNEYGSIHYTKDLVEFIAESSGVKDKILINAMPKEEAFAKADIVTNLGHVRPINEYYIKLMKKDAVVTLMCEPWECRESDCDIHACRQNNIAVMGTNESDPKLDTFGYIGHLIVKLAMEKGIEIKGSRICIIGTGYKGYTGKPLLEMMRAKIEDKLTPFTDALVIIEPNHSQELIKAEQIMDINPAIVVIHIVGNIDKMAMMAEGISVNPPRIVSPGRMAAALDYLGPKPIIDLHTAGLKVGESLVRGLRLKGSFMDAEYYAVHRSPAKSVNTVLHGRIR